MPTPMTRRRERVPCSIHFMRGATTYLIPRRRGNNLSQLPRKTREPPCEACGAKRRSHRERLTGNGVRVGGPKCRENALHVRGMVLVSLPRENGTPVRPHATPPRPTRALDPRE